MTYELDKQLKDAGFPQEYRLQVITIKGIMDEHSAKEMGYEYANILTLSELIEACGEDFKELGQTLNKDWYATDNDATYGSTPEEAVAKLWLELNKK